MGELVDIEDAISAHKEAVRLTPDGHYNKPTYFSNLGISLVNRFDRSGQLVDIEDAISSYKDAVRLTPDGYRNKPLYLFNLGASLSRRFRCFGEPADIEDAISTQKDAVRLTPDGYAYKPEGFNNLGVSLVDRFDRSGQLVDIEDAISTHKDAVRLTPDCHPNKPLYLNNLGISFLRRFERSGELVDIEEAISAHKDAVRLTPDGHSLKPPCLNSLGNSFSSRFDRSGQLADIEEAISALKDAVRLTPDGHADKPARLANLGDSCQRRFQRFRYHQDFDDSIAHYRLSATCLTGPPLIRLQSALRWARLTSATSLNGYSVAVDLIPRMAWFGQTISQRYKVVQLIAGIGNEAAAAAIALGKFDTALEWLEQGRSIVWGQLLNLRTPVDELHHVRPDLALDLVRISRALDSAPTCDFQSRSPNQSTSASHHQVAKTRHQLADQWEALLTRVRAVPGFEDFLRVTKLAQLLKAAQFGPVVYINVHDSRCDALILKPDRDDVIHVPLEGLSHDRALKFRDSLRASLPLPGPGGGFVEILSTLWNTVAKPILDPLELHVSHSSFHCHRFIF